MAATGNKRKRESMDQTGPHGPQAPGADFSHMSPGSNQAFESQYLQHTPEGDLTLAEALAQHNAGAEHGAHEPETNGQSATDTASAALHYSMTVPEPTETTFLAQAANEAERHPEPNFDIDTPSHAQDASAGYSNYAVVDQLKENAAQQPQHDQAQALPRSAEADPAESSPTSGSKPSVGSDEWQKVRKDNHKEVERRRRETINEGINELAKIVPGVEKNKGSILARAVSFIQQLKENETQNIEKWTLEKLLTEQAIAELSSTCDKIKSDLRDSRRELEAWKACGKRLSVEPNAEDQSAAQRIVERDD